MKLLTRSCVVLAVLALFLALPGMGGRLTSAQAAAADPTPDEQELDAQRRAAGMQVLSNMVANGINPREFFTEVMSEMPDGGFDVEVLKQKLIDRKLISEETINQIEATTERVAAARMQRDLDIQEAAEWDVLKAKIQKVIDAGYAAGAPLSRGAFFGLRPTIKGKTQVQTLLAAVKAVSKDPDATPEVINQKLDAWRAAKQKAQAAYVEAQKQLIEVCTKQQETYFTMVGLVD